ncbi:hypothetical protein EC912_10696 [Luteibacter rhizovicinus]|uniref:Uncharacterized protein n=1 Tax=Luteibacter rhizovicinus TaxID=242606 RepID=A0A4R3YMM6_9GAMM|nr:hypothetical protein EC912_10696 [Luteibacter rhizovicinus]
MDVCSDRAMFPDPAPDHRDTVVRLFPARCPESAMRDISMAWATDRDEYELGGYAGI